MSNILPQYSGFQNLPQNQTGGLSPLQLAAAYYMIQGQQIPFFVNHDWLRALRVYCDSGIVDPKVVGGTGAVVVEQNNVYTIETAADCGPDEKNRTELVYRGSIDTLPIDVWAPGVTDVIRGGSVANGAGGPWGTGGITGASPVPGNSVGQPDPVVSNVAAEYSINVSEESLINSFFNNPIQFGNTVPVNIQGIG